jgi:hypothetical protein
VLETRSMLDSASGVFHNKFYNLSPPVPDSGLDCPGDRGLNIDQSKPLCFPS